MRKDEVMAELALMGDEQNKNIFLKHGAREPFYGVKVEDLKKILKKTGKNYLLSLELYATGNSDAMYLAGLMSEPEKMSREELQTWAEQAYWYMISEYTVAFVLAASPFAEEMAAAWIEDPRENIASAGWAAYAQLIAKKPAFRSNIVLIKNLLIRVRDQIHISQNRVKYTMNGFLISAGAYISDLREMSVKIAEETGKVKVDMGGTSCKVPYAPEYIQKVAARVKIK